MKILEGFLYKFFLILCLGITLTACSKLTEENFDRIKAGMSLKEVIVILSEPVSLESTNFAGMSGTIAKWKNYNSEITILFFNDKVQYKSLSTSKEKNMEKE